MRFERCDVHSRRDPLPARGLLDFDSSSDVLEIHDSEREPLRWIRVDSRNLQAVRHFNGTEGAYIRREEHLKPRAAWTACRIFRILGESKRDARTSR